MAEILYENYDGFGTKKVLLCRVMIEPVGEVIGQYAAYGAENRVTIMLLLGQAQTVQLSMDRVTDENLGQLRIAGQSIGHPLNPSAAIHPRDIQSLPFSVEQYVQLLIALGHHRYRFCTVNGNINGYRAWV